MTSILRHVAETFPPARQGTILDFHRVIGMATNTSIVLNCALVTYIMMTADVGLLRLFAPPSPLPLFHCTSSSSYFVM